MFRKFALPITATLIFAPLQAFAQTIQLFKPIVPSSCYSQAGGCTSLCDLATVVNNLIFDLNILIVFFCAFWFFGAGWDYATAGMRGQTMEMATAKMRLARVVLAIVVVLIPYILVVAFLKIFIPGFTNIKFC